MTIKNVSTHLQLSWDIVKSIQKCYLKKRYAKLNLKDLEQIAIDEIKMLEGKFSKKFNSSIKLNFEKKDVDGIKIDIDSLGIEIGFSRERVQTAMLEHILKAI